MVGTQKVSIAQNVLIENQADVDAFDPSTTIINGYLQIGVAGMFSNITHLSNLSNLTNVTGNVIINYNTELTNLDDLNSLISIGGDLDISANFTLTNIDGLSNLGFIGSDLVIASNSNLVHIDGLNKLTTIGSSFSLSGNAKLTNIDGLSNLNAIEGSLWISSGNAKLTNIDGLSNVTFIGGFLSISGTNILTNIDGLSGITTVENDLIISGNAELENLDGLINLTSARSYVQLNSNDKLGNIDGLSNLETIDGHLVISLNANLVDLNGLSNLTTIGDYLWIFKNERLINLDGLISLTSIGEFLNINTNHNLVDCCAITDLLENQATAIGGSVSIFANPSECSSPEEVLDGNCRMRLILATTPPCIGAENGSIQVYVQGYDTIPFYYEWFEEDSGNSGNGVSESDDFTIDMLGAGIYNITVTNEEPDTAIKLDVVLSHKEGYIFEIIEVKTTNSSNGQSNGSITLTTTGGTGPYNYRWSGVAMGEELGVVNEFYTIPMLSYGEYIVEVEDATGSSKIAKISLLDETVQVIPCEKPLDIVILNDVSGSVDAVEYKESKQFFVDFLKEVNIGPGADESRAAIIEWSTYDEQQVKIPITGEIGEIESYLDDSRSFDGSTAPHQAMKLGKEYLDTNARPNAEKVMILSTDGTGGQISSSLVALADDFKAKGYHILSIAFDDAFSDSSTRDILRRVASVDALAPGAPSYSLLDVDLAQNIVFNYLCPIDPGSSATAYFNRDGAIDIVDIDPVGNCPYPDFVEVTIDISAYRELSIPAGTPITFYHNNPNQSGSTPILTWMIPCVIPVDSIETYTITLPMDGPSNIFSVLNDDGEQGPPINFPITEIEELAYSNNIDNERICLDENATIQAFKYSSLPIPSCDTIVNYTINVCNISEVDAFGISVTDLAPPGFELTGYIFNDNGCGVNIGVAYDIPADCCFSLFLTYDASEAEYGYYDNQGVNIDGPD